MATTLPGTCDTMESEIRLITAFTESASHRVFNQGVIQINANLRLWKEAGKREALWLLTICEQKEFWCPGEQNFVLPKECKGCFNASEGRAALCRNQEHSEKLIKTLPSDYTPEDANRFLSRPSLTQLAPKECKGWVGSSPVGQ